jgi:hypothetical protein
MKKNKLAWIIVTTILILLIAFGLRTYAVFHLNTDHDELTYLTAGNNYAVKLACLG